MNLFSRYFSDLIIPLSVIAGGVVLGIIIERFVGRFLYRFFERKGWPIGRRLTRAFNGLFITWLGLAAFRSVLSDFPLKPSAFPVAAHIVSAILVLSIAVLIVRILIAFIRTYSSDHKGAVASISLIENIVRAVIYTLGVLAIFRVFGVAVTPLLTALGVGGLAVALALQDTLSNFFAGIYIIISKQLSTGDYIKLSSGEEGVIRDIAWRVTTLETSTQTLTIIPNNKFSTSTITNFDRPDKFTSIVIPITSEPHLDTTHFERLVLDAAKEVIRNEADALKEEPTFELTALASTGNTAELMVQISDYKQQGHIRHEILKRVAERMRVVKAPHVSESPTSSTQAVEPKKGEEPKNEPVKDGDKR